MSTKASPNELPRLLQQAQQLVAQRKFKQALELGNRLSSEYAENPGIWELMCDLYFAAGKAAVALGYAEKIADYRPEDTHAQLQLAKCQVAAGRKINGLDTLNKVITMQGLKGARMNDAVGSLYSICDEPEKALPYLKQAVQEEPNNPVYVTNLAMVQRMVGDFDGAKSSFDRSINLDPHDYKAYYARSDLKKWDQANNHTLELETVIRNGCKQWRGEVSVRFAIAKEYDDLEENDKSFEHLKAANDLQRRHTRYDVHEDVTAMELIRKKHTGGALDAMGAGYSSREPIFVFGLPRTGTTLVERILGSHSTVYSAGEINNFYTELVRCVRESSNQKTLSKNEMITQTLLIDPEKLGQAYIESTRPRTGQTAHFIDKLPFNYLYAGMIHATLPKSRSVVLVRNPLDACYSIYKMMFHGVYPFSYDLQELGKYFLAFRQLIDHWTSELSDALLVVEYEQLVQNSEREIRRLLEYCELEWEDACLKFHRSEAASTTASAVQVRQPMYTSSIGKWRQYEKQLEPLRRIFLEHGLSVD